jgi:hypothetical protein
MVGYLCVAYVANFIRFRTFNIHRKRVISNVFESATFAGSFVILLGIHDPNVLTLIGNTKPFLMIGGLSGVVYSVHAIFPPPPGTS